MSDALIEKLIYDKYFGIYTRNGFEYVLKYLYADCKFYLIDFDDVGGLNECMGYIKVNDLLREVFKELKNDYIIGRAFSGDEIFFQTYRLDDDISKIKDVCKKYNLSFNYIEKYYNIKNQSRFCENHLSNFLECMINNFH